MKNQSRYIPESISGLSNNSINLHGINNQSMTELQSESTDHLVSEILKARAERLLKQQQEYQAEKSHNISLEDIFSKTVAVKEEIPPHALHNVSHSHIPTELNVSANHELPSQRGQPEQSDHLEQSPSKKLQVSQGKEKRQNQEASEKASSHYIDLKEFQNEEGEKIEQSVNEAQQEIQLHREQILEGKTERMKKQLQKEQKPEIHFDLHNQNKSNSQSIELSFSNPDKSDQKHRENAPYQPFQQQHYQTQHNYPTPAVKLQNNEAHLNAEREDVSEHNDSNRTPEGMEAIQSQIAPKPDASIPDIIVTQNKRNQTDQEVVQALTDRLNQINEIEEAENMENLSKKRQPSKNPSIGNFSKGEDKLGLLRQMAKPGSEFETEYSDDIRDFRILEHHYESNIHMLEIQLNEMIELHEALILEQECIELRKNVKAKEMENRRYKIMLRNASYSKKFNFHSPIPKNNNSPLQFCKKFKVGPLYASQYYEMVHKIAEEKKLQQQLTKQYDIFNRFYQLMKSKQISSYPQLPFDLQYDSQLQKYSIKGGLQASTSPRGGKSTHYQFDKSKRSLQIDNNEVNYYDLLNYKRDISRDAMLEFEVYNLGRIKKLKDQNKLIQKEILFVQQQIQQVDRQFKLAIGQNIGSGVLLSQRNIKTKTSFSRSPVIKNKTLYQLNNYVSPMERVAQMNKSIKSQGKLRLSLSKQKPTTKLKFSNSKEPKEIKRIKSPETNLKKVMIPEIQDEYGLSDLKKYENKGNQIPTFGKKESQQLIVKYRENKYRNRSGQKNYIQINKKLSTRTEVNLGEKKERTIIKRLQSANISPIKKHTFTEPSLSIDQTNPNFHYLI